MRKNIITHLFTKYDGEIETILFFCNFVNFFPRTFDLDSTDKRHIQISLHSNKFASKGH